MTPFGIGYSIPRHIPIYGGCDAGLDHRVYRFDGKATSNETTMHKGNPTTGLALHQARTRVQLRVRSRNYLKEKVPMI